MGNGVDFMMHTINGMECISNDEQLEIALNQNPETLGTINMNSYINQGDKDTRFDSVKVYRT